MRLAAEEISTRTEMMMTTKIYIVSKFTSFYSGYILEKVFWNKIEAEEYASSFEDWTREIIEMEVE